MRAALHYVCIAYDMLSCYLELFHSGFDLGVAHVLLAHQVVVYPGLCVAHNEEGPAHLTHLHLFLLGCKALDGLDRKYKHYVIWTVIGRVGCNK